MGHGFLDDLPLPSDQGLIAGKYRILGMLGRGGMGIVFRARHESLGHDVAIKMLTGARFVDPTARERFLQEARAIARLRHRNIVTVHDWGEDQGQPFLCMEYVEGGSLAELLQRGTLEFRKAAVLVELVAVAIDHAHTRGLVHRDLKPSNILLDGQGEPKVVDFGLAKDVGTDTTELTLSGEVLGTPGYLAPEQVNRALGPVGTHTDVYALGGLLYALLTGRAPVLARDLAEALPQVLEADPPAPRSIRPSVPRELETICLRCLEKEPGRRYASAALVAERLRRWLDGKPIPDTPISAWGRVGKWARRRPGVARLTASLAVTVLLAAGTVAWQHVRAERRLEQISDARKAEQAFESGEAFEGIAVLARAVARHRTYRPITERLLNALNGRQFLVPVPAPNDADAPLPSDLQAEFRIARFGNRQKLAWVTEPDAVNIALGDEASAGAGVVLTNAHQKVIRSLACSADGRWLVSASADGTAKVWDIQTPGAYRSFVHPGAVNHAVFSPTAETIATACRDGIVRLWTSADPSKPVLELHQGSSVAAVRFRADGRVILSAGDDQTLRLWDLRTSRMVCEPRHFPLPILDAGFANGDHTVHVLQLDGQVWWLGLTPLDALGLVRNRRRYDPLDFARGGKDATLAQLAQFGFGAANYGEVSADGRWLAVTHQEEVILVDLRTRRLLPNRLHLGVAAQWVRFDPGGQRLAASTSDGRVRVWDRASGLALTDWIATDEPVTRLGFTTAGSLAIGSPSSEAPRLYVLATVGTRHPEWLPDLALALVNAPPANRPCQTYAEQLAWLKQITGRLSRTGHGDELASWARQMLPPWGPHATAEE